MSPNVQVKEQQTIEKPKLSLAALLAKSMEDDGAEWEDPTDVERFDKDEGSFGG